MCFGSESFKSPSSPPVPAPAGIAGLVGGISNFSRDEEDAVSTDTIPERFNSILEDAGVTPGSETSIDLVDLADQVSQALALIVNRANRTHPAILGLFPSGPGPVAQIVADLVTNKIEIDLRDGNLLPPDLSDDATYDALGEYFNLRSHR